MSRRLPTLTPRKVIQALERGGFVLHRIRGAITTSRILIIRLSW